MKFISLQYSGKSLKRSFYTRDVFLEELAVLHEGSDI